MKSISIRGNVYIYMMSKKVLLFCFVPILASLLSACFTNTVMQSGKTEGKNNARIAANMTIGDTRPYRSSNYDETNYLPMLEIASAYGLAKRFDLQFNINSTSYASVGGKFQFIGDSASKFAMSIGSEFGFAAIGALVLDLKNYHYSVPLYTSLHFNSKSFIYCSPRYTYTSFGFSKSKIYNGKSDEILQIFGGNYGISYGKKYRFCVEIGHYELIRIKPTQISVGFTFVN
jgi:hypothetical protein